MRNKKIKQKILKVSKGIISHLSEFLLLEIKVLEVIFTTPPGKMTARELDRRISRRLDLVPNSRRTQNLIYQAKKRGLITNNLALTKQGEARLKEIFPSWKEPSKWNKKWYLVIFDIPEKLRYKRDILRDKLKQLGFGQLQQSVWLSPYNYFFILLKIVQKYHLENYVIFSIADKIGIEKSQELTDRVWKLFRINQEYKDFIERYSSDDSLGSSKFELEIDYFSVLSRDPQLPKELLPSDWKAKEAFNLHQKLSKKEI